MTKDKVIVLGAGIAGISAAYHIQQEFTKKKISDYSVSIYEKANEWGGLCGGFHVSSNKGDFWFDYAVHLSFAKDYVQHVFKESSTPLIHIPDATNYYDGVWVKHPAQNNLYALPLEIKINAIKDMLINNNQKENLENFEQWLKAQYGSYFVENFSMKYTRKYWTTEANCLNTNPKWVGYRFYIPNAEEILLGAMSNETPNYYYTQELRYPQEGQYRSFFKSLMKHQEIFYNKEAIAIDTESQAVIFSDNTKVEYTTLVSTIPLPVMINMINGGGCVPSSVRKAASCLHATSVALVSLGFNREDIPKNLWFYIYDEDKLFARVHSPSFKSPQNVPKGCSSMQAEIYFSDFKTLQSMAKNHIDLKEFFIEHVKTQFVQMGICNKEDIICEDFRIYPFANVMFTHGMEENRQICMDFLQSHNIFSCGRFGKWDYLWSDQSFLSGKEVVNEIRDSKIIKSL